MFPTFLPPISGVRNASLGEMFRCFIGHLYSTTILWQFVAHEHDRMLLVSCFKPQCLEVQGLSGTKKLEGYLGYTKVSTRIDGSLTKPLSILFCIVTILCAMELVMRPVFCLYHSLHFHCSTVVFFNNVYSFLIMTQVREKGIN